MSADGTGDETKGVFTTGKLTALLEARRAGLAPADAIHPHGDGLGARAAGT